MSAVFDPDPVTATIFCRGYMEQTERNIGILLRQTDIEYLDCIPLQLMLELVADLMVDKFGEKGVTLFRLMSKYVDDKISTGQRLTDPK